MELAGLAGLPFTYPEVGATAGQLPPGYHHVRASAVIGEGRQRFESAAASIRRWGMLRGTGLWWSKAVGPVTSLLQRLITTRGLSAV